MIMTRVAKCIGWLVEEENLEPRGKTASTNYCPSGRADVINHSCDLVRSKIHYFTYFISYIHKFLKKINSPALWLGNRKVFQVIFDSFGGQDRNINCTLITDLL